MSRLVLLAVLLVFAAAHAMLLFRQDAAVFEAAPFARRFTRRFTRRFNNQMTSSQISNVNNELSQQVRLTISGQDLTLPAGAKHVFYESVSAKKFKVNGPPQLKGIYHLPDGTTHIMFNDNGVQSWSRDNGYEVL